MAFGQSGFGSKEERMDPAGGLKAFAGGRGAPAPIQNSEEKEMRDKAINSIADTSLKTVGGVEGAHLANFGKAAKGLGQAIMGTTPIAPPTLGAGIGSGTAIMGAPAAAGGIGSAMAGVGSAMLPFAGPLALAALPFLFNKGTESVGGNTMETDDINEIANNYAMMTGGSSRVMPRPVMGGAPFMDRPADVDTAGGVQPFMAATPNLGKSSESQLLNKFYSPGMGYGLAGIGEGLFDSAYMRKAPPVVNQVPSMENVSGRDVSTEFPGVYTAPRAPVNVEMTTPSYREVNPLDYHMRQWYGMPNIMKGVDALKSIWGTPVANESNHGYYKGGTHKVAGIDPQKYARGEDDVGLYEDMYPGNFGLTDFGKEEWVPSPGMGDGFSEWGVDSIFDKNYFDPRDYSRANTMGPQMAGGWTKWHENKYDELFDLYEQTGRPDVLRDLQELSRESRFYQGFHLPGVPLKYNSGTSSVPVPPNTAGYLKDALLKENMQRELKNYLQKSGPNFQGIADQGKNIQRNMKAREVQSMLNNLQRQPRLPLSSVGNLSKTLFKGGPLGAAISTAMTPTMAADATWSDAEWSGMMGGNKAMSDREMKQQLHSQKMRQNEEAHRAKMMAQ